MRSCSFQYYHLTEKKGSESEPLTALCLIAALRCRSERHLLICVVQRATGYCVM